MFNKDNKKRNELIAVILIIASGIVLYLCANKIINISAGSEKTTYVDIINELHKYDCSFEDNINKNHYITDDKCAFEIEFIENTTYDNFSNYIDKVNDNGNGSKNEFTYSINGSLVSKESTGVKYYKYAAYKNNTILYLSTLNSFNENAKSIINNIGFKYNLTIHFEYAIIPIILFVIGVILIVFPTNKRKKVKGRK